MREKLCLEDFVKTAKIPQSLVSFEDDTTNEAAYNIFTALIQKYDIGKAIAITRHKLNAMGLNMEPKQEKKQPTSIATKPVPQPETPGLFGKEEDYLRYFS